MKKIILVCLQILFLTIVLKAADTASARYFPLAIGNKWVYLNASSMGGPFTYWTTVTQITRDTIINNKKYFFINKIQFGMSNFWIRYDSTNGHLNCFIPSSPDCNYERMFYDLSDVLGDSCNNVSMPCVFNIYVCDQVKDSILFGLNSTIKSYHYTWYNHNGEGHAKNIFAKDIGYFNHSSIYMGSQGQIHNYIWLKGFIINGQLYGDTTSTNVNLITNSVPDNYSLSQNYPNPFNPKTNIKFDIQKTSVTKMIIYDALGREIETLVNEVLKAGSYQVDWDGSGYTSGIYFYKLIAGDYVDVKKMVLVK